MVLVELYKLSIGFNCVLDMLVGNSVSFNCKSIGCALSCARLY